MIQVVFLFPITAKRFSSSTKNTWSTPVPQKTSSSNDLCLFFWTTVYPIIRGVAWKVTKISLTCHAKMFMSILDKAYNSKKTQVSATASPTFPTCSSVLYSEPILFRSCLKFIEIIGEKCNSVIFFFSALNQMHSVLAWKCKNKNLIKMVSVCYLRQMLVLRHRNLWFTCTLLRTSGSMLAC